MNAGAWDASQSEGHDISGWDVIAGNGFPSLTGLPAAKPEDGQTTFYVSDTDIVLPASDGQFRIDVCSALGSTVSGFPEWIRLLSEDRSETSPFKKTYRFLYDANTDGCDRNCAIIFENSAGTRIEVRISQDAPHLILSESTLSFSSVGGSRRVYLKTNLPWMVSCDAPWCSVSRLSGFSDAPLEFTVSENTDSESRSATLTLRTDDGSLTGSLTVVQSGLDPDPDAWKTHAFKHNSLMMRFTATWCGWCPMMCTSVERAQDQLPDKILHVALHGGGSDLQIAETYPLVQQFSIYNYPSGIVDGRIRIENCSHEVASSAIIRAVKETEDNYDTRTGIGLSYSVSGQEVHIDVDVYIRKQGAYKLTVFLMEDGIVAGQADNELDYIERYIHNNIVKSVATNALGDPFTVEEDFSVKHFNRTAVIPEGCDPAHMRVLAYTQTTFDGRPVLHSADYGDYYIDNCVSVTLGGRVHPGLLSELSDSDNEGVSDGGEIDM